MARRIDFMTLLRGCAAFTLAAALALVTGAQARAQTIAVDGGLGEEGFGWMFREGGVCYAVLPAHVAGPLPRIAVQSSAPVTVGTGQVIRPFWEGIDLALAVLRGGIEPRCEARLDDLTVSPRGRTAGVGQLHRITDAGEEERIGMRIVSREYLTLEAEVASSADRIYKGTSGAFLFVGEEPVAMALRSDDPRRARLMRAEEIAINLRRYLREQGAAFAAATEPVPIAGPGGLALTVAEVTAPPLGPRQGPESVLGEGVYAFAPQRGAEILLEVADGGAALSRLRIESPADAGYALPRRIVVMTGNRARPEGMRVWARGEMGPDGLYDSGEKSARPVRWIKVVIATAWGGGPIAVGRIEAR